MLAFAFNLFMAAIFWNSATESKAHAFLFGAFATLAILNGTILVMKLVGWA